MDRNNPTQRAIKNTFQRLAENDRFKRALDTTIGQELLVESVKKTAILLEKIIGLKATDEEIIEYRILLEITTKWANRIFQYESDLLKVKDARTE